MLNIFSIHTNCSLLAAGRSNKVYQLIVRYIVINCFYYLNDEISLIKYEQKPIFEDGGIQALQDIHYIRCFGSIQLPCKYNASIFFQNVQNLAVCDVAKFCVQPIYIYILSGPILQVCMVLEFQVKSFLLHWMEFIKNIDVFFTL